MARQFEAKRAEDPGITLRDFLAMMMPKPPGIDPPVDCEERFIHEMKERYSMADHIIEKVR